MAQFTDTIVIWLQTHIGNPYLTVFLLSMIPMVEVRGAIPVAMQLGLTPGMAFLFSSLSALVVCPVLLLGLQPLLRALKRTKAFRRLAGAIEARFASKAGEIEQKAAHSRRKLWLKILGLYAFVALPLPLTGVWTGSAVAAFLDLKYRYSVPTLVVGNLTAAGIITLLSVLLGDKSFIILLVLGVFILVSLIVLAIGMFAKSRPKDPEP